MHYKVHNDHLLDVHMAINLLPLKLFSKTNISFIQISDELGFDVHHNYSNDKLLHEVLSQKQDHARMEVAHIVFPVINDEPISHYSFLLASNLPKIMS